MPWITEADVQELFPGRSDLSFAPFITVASAVTDDIATFAASKSLTIGDTRKKQICLYLAAHFTELSYTSGALAAESVGQATERYHNVYDAGLKLTRFGQQALLLDSTGYLAQLTAAAQNPNIKQAEFRVV